MSNQLKQLLEADIAEYDAALTTTPYLQRINQLERALLAVLNEPKDEFPRVRSGKTGEVLHGKPTPGLIEMSAEAGQYGLYTTAAFNLVTQQWYAAEPGDGGREVWVETDPRAVSCPELAKPALV